MIKTVNPGRLVILEGSFELGASLGEVDAVDGPRYLSAYQRHAVVDRESRHAAPTLADLLRSLLEDPAERITGPIRITIEAAA